MDEIPVESTYFLRHTDSDDCGEEPAKGGEPGEHQAPQQDKEEERKQRLLCLVLCSYDGSLMCFILLSACVMWFSKLFISFFSKLLIWVSTCYKWFSDCLYVVFVHMCFSIMPIVIRIFYLLLCSYYAYYYDHTMPIIMIVLCILLCSYYAYYDHIMHIIIIIICIIWK